MIYYRVGGRDPALLRNFTGTDLYELNEAIKSKSQFEFPLDNIKLSAGKPGEEKQNLYDMDELH